MSTTIQPVKLTSLQFTLLGMAGAVQPFTLGWDRKIARALAKKGLGTVSRSDAGQLQFQINEAGRDQLRIRA